MQLKHIVLENYCQFSYFETPLSPGTTAFIGPNGSGKSNLVGAIRYALTGVNPNVGVKADNVYVGAGRNKPSRVTLLFSHGSVQGTIVRNLKAAKPSATLHLSTGEVVEGDTLVTERIEQLLGVSSDVINDIVIVAQDDLYGFLDKLPSKRKEQFQRLFNTTRAEVVYDGINAYLKTLLISDYTETIAATQYQLLEAQNQAAIADAAAAGYDAATMQMEISAIQQVLHQQSWRLSTMATLSSVQQQEISLASQEAVALEQAQLAETSEMSFDAFLTTNDAKYNETLTFITNANQNRQFFEKRKQLESQQEMLNAAFSTLIAPQLPAGYVASAETRNQLSLAQADIKAIEVSLRGYDPKAPVCPTCGQSSEKLTAWAASQVEKQTQLLAQVKELTITYQVATAYELAVSQYNDILTRTRNNLANVSAALQATPVVTEVPDIAAAEEFRRYFLEQRRLKAEATAAVLKCRSEHTRISGMLAQIRQTIAGYEESLRSVPELTSDQIAVERQRLHKLQTDVSEAVQRLQDAAAARARVTTLGQSLLNLQTAQQANAEKLLWKQHLEDVRDLFHKDAAPKFVAHRNLQRLQHDMNWFLGLFDTNYRVTADEGLSFQAHFLNGVVQPVERLSGGQKGVVALTFRFAINRMFADRIEALILDEPTAYQDEHHIRGFEPVLAKLNEFASSRGLQCIIVTHEAALAPLFQHTVKLGQ